MDRERAKLQRDLDRLTAQRREIMRGRMTPNTRAQILQRKINNVKRKIAEIDRDAVERLNFAEAPFDEIIVLIAIPLLADVIIDLLADVNRILRKYGVGKSVFGVYASRISRASLAMIDTLATATGPLTRVLMDDDTLVDAIRKKLMTYIKQRLKCK